MVLPFFFLTLLGVFGPLAVPYYPEVKCRCQSIFQTSFYFETTLLYNRCVQNKKLATLLEIAENNDGYVSTDDLKRESIERAYLSFAVEEGLFRRVGKGLYLRKGHEEDPYYLLHHTYKKAVFASSSALALWGLCEDKGLTVYLPTGYMTAGIPNAKSRHVGKKEYGLGQTLIVTKKGNIVPTFDLERTLLDVIRHPYIYKKEELIKTLKAAYAKSPSLEKLEAYAKSFHCLEALRVIEALYR